MDHLGSQLAGRRRPCRRQPRHHRRRSGDGREEQGGHRFAHRLARRELRVQHMLAQGASVLLFFLSPCLIFKQRREMAGSARRLFWRKRIHVWNLDGGEFLAAR
jgi:hypothetical protein